jgi:hypothetical protein
MHFSEFLHRETRVQQHLAYQYTLLILDYPVVRFVSVVHFPSGGFHEWTNCCSLMVIRIEKVDTT